MKKRLFTPGPTPVPEDILLEMSGPIIHHRTAEFRRIAEEVQDNLKYLFQTKNPVITLASSGTGAMEAAVSNILSSGEKAVVVKGGKFGERFAEICSSYGVDVIPLDVEWGKAVKPASIEEILNKEKEIKAVFTTLCETSTGVLNDVEAIGKIVESSDTVLIVDAVSSLGAVPCQTDAWNLDVVISGSQKALMLPPGLSFISVSKKAWRKIENTNSSRYYLDLRKYHKSLEKSDFPFTPAVSLIVGLRKSLTQIREEGIENVLQRHKILAAATRAAIKALGLELFAEKPADSLTAVKVPEGIDSQELIKRLKEKYGVNFAGGQNELKGKIFRIAHLGYFDKLDIITAIAALEMVLSELGHKFELGSGIKAAERILTQES